MMRYAVYGDLAARDSIALVTALSAKRIGFDFVAETPALSLALAARAGRDDGPFLRTPEGFIVGDLHTILDYLERLHPEPTWRPTSPVRHACARLLEDWIELWLPVWPARARSVLEALSRHLETTGFLLGATPCRPDGSLAAWLEADVLSDPELREYLSRHAPRLLRYVAEVRSATLSPATDDAIPLSLLEVLCEIATDYLIYLEGNREALLAGSDHVEIDFGLGTKTVPAWRHCEERRAALGQDLAALAGSERRSVRQMLDPLGAWRTLCLPAVVDPIALGDPRSF